MSHRYLLPGRVYRFLYPAANLTCLRFICPMRERTLLVLRVRDILAEPLDEETLTMHPYTNRGRWLVTGLDLEKFEERSFYVESMVAVLEISKSQSVSDMPHQAALHSNDFASPEKFGRDTILDLLQAPHGSAASIRVHPVYGTEGGISYFEKHPGGLPAAVERRELAHKTPECRDKQLGFLRLPLQYKCL